MGGMKWPGRQRHVGVGTKPDSRLYRAESVAEVVEVVGGFFEGATDETVAAMRALRGSHASRAEAVA